MTLRLISLAGLFVFMALAYVISNNRKKINKRTVIFGISLQFVFALIILKTSVGKAVFSGARVAVTKLLSFTDHGAEFLFGKLYLGDGGIAQAMGKGGPYQLIDGSTGAFTDIGPVFAFHVLPTIIFFAALMSVLYHLGIMQKLVKGLAWVMTRFMGVSGAESLSAASNIFVGQTEAPFVVAPFLPKMTLSEIMAVMTGGFATVAGGVMAAYVRFGIDPRPPLGRQRHVGARGPGHRQDHLSRNRQTRNGRQGAGPPEEGIVQRHRRGCGGRGGGGPQAGGQRGRHAPGLHRPSSPC